jgi:hypothetical protein
MQEYDALSSSFSSSVVRRSGDISALVRFFSMRVKLKWILMD